MNSAKGIAARVIVYGLVSASILIAILVKMRLDNNRRMLDDGYIASVANEQIHNKDIDHLYELIFNEVINDCKKNFDIIIKDDDVKAVKLYEIEIVRDIVDLKYGFTNECEKNNIIAKEIAELGISDTNIITEEDRAFATDFITRRKVIEALSKEYGYKIKQESLLFSDLSKDDWRDLLKKYERKGFFVIYDEGQRKLFWNNLKE